jgi:predicted HicB family RNase H-like nuclease
VKRGRPKVAETISNLTVRLDANVHDALIREALHRDVPVAEVVREALFSHLVNSPMQGTSAQ